MNPYLEGSLEWHAWGDGATFTPEVSTPEPRSIIRMAWVAVMGGDWDTYHNGLPADRDHDEAILRAWRLGTAGVEDDHTFDADRGVTVSASRDEFQGT